MYGYEKELQRIGARGVGIGVGAQRSDPDRICPLPRPWLVDTQQMDTELAPRAFHVSGAVTSLLGSTSRDPLHRHLRRPHQGGCAGDRDFVRRHTRRCELPLSGPGGGAFMMPQGVPIFVATQTVDMRLGMERLGGLVRERLGQDVRRRALFVFVGKRRISAKILSWDETGMLLLTKRLHTRLFSVPVSSRENESCVVVSDALLRVLLDGEESRSNKKRTRH